MSFQSLLNRGNVLTFIFEWTVTSLFEPFLHLVAAWLPRGSGEVLQMFFMWGFRKRNWQQSGFQNMAKLAIFQDSRWDNLGYLKLCLLEPRPWKHQVPHVLVIQRRSSSSSSNRMTPTSPPPSKLKQNKFQQSPTQGPLSSPENSATPQDRQPWLGCHVDEPEPLNSGLELKQFVFIAHHVHYSYPIFASMEQPDTFWGLAVRIGVINLCNGPIRLQFRRPTTARCVTARAGPSADWVVTFPNGQMKEKQAASTFTWASVHIFGNRMGG